MTAETRGYPMPAERSLAIENASDIEAAEAILERAPVAQVLIAGRSIGPGHPCFVIAEIGVNHNGDLDLALRMIDAAAQAGADAAKFQTFRTERVISRAARQAEYQRRNTGVAESQFEMVRRLELGDTAFARLAERCAQKGILFLSSPFDEGSAELLDALGVPAFKIGSGELTNHPFLASLARRGRPLLLSTGMATLREVDLALAVIRRHGNPPVALLHCVSSYPSAAGESNLAAIETMRRAFNVPVGWSDHSLGIHVSIAAVARGACILERHFTLDRTLPGPDHAASLDPVEFGQLVVAVRDVEAAIGSGQKVPRDSERDTAEVARRSLHVARDLAAGARLTSEDLVLLRPGTGLPPSALATTVGRTTRRALGAGEMLEEADLE
jgi:N-acetylneuraminate synthase